MQTGCKRDSLFCRTSRERPISSIKSFVKIDNRATLPNSACPSSPIRCPSWLPEDARRRSSSSSSSWKRLSFSTSQSPCTNRFFPGPIKIFPQPLTSYAYHGLSELKRTFLQPRFRGIISPKLISISFDEEYSRRNSNGNFKILLKNRLPWKEATDQVSIRENSSPSFRSLSLIPSSISPLSTSSPSLVPLLNYFDKPPFRRD